MLYAEVAAKKEMISEEQQAPTGGVEKKTKGMQGGERVGQKDKMGVGE